MADRETKIVTTPAGHKIELRTYLTGREANQLKELLLADLKLSTADIESGKVEIGDIPASFLVKQEEKSVELLVVSIDGVTDNAAQTVLHEFPEREYQAVIEAINEIRNPTTPEK